MGTDLDGIEQLCGAGLNLDLHKSSKLVVGASADVNAVGLAEGNGILDEGIYL